ncbi:tyrosine-type recombinase/integrase [Ruegeria sp. HKCCD4884]|uniref:tyrosine-type recombinase/integrase n=1 Tax=Ruegeria sp. HKCCD4884 TaxID=2683022 RepID=UPI001491E6E5|nr:site-specific integrase [Ruegeria sp. HKCCD4884]NOD94070.1 tyrosine-type recombinase/integrase [Ruegeria sp. HKCCD4884]
MSKHTSDNLRIKRKHLVWLKDAKGLSQSSTDKAAASIAIYDRWLKGKDYRAFHSERARAFKRHLQSLRNERTGAPLSAATINGVLRDVMKLFDWMADQPGYKSKISRSDIAYLTPDRKSEQARRSTLWKPHPSPEQVDHLLSSMPVETVIQRRDRALIAFLFLTGSREGAAITVQLRHVDLANRCVQFDGRSVDTKFGKSFTASFFPFGDNVEQIMREWIGELRKDHLFSDTDALFPKTRVAVGPSRRFETMGIAREPWAGPSSAAGIFKKAFINAGLPPFSPHRVRDTIAELAKLHCRTPEDYKAWSQNMGHDDVMTTFSSYGSVSPGRQVELMGRFRRRGPLPDEDAVIDE